MSLKLKSKIKFLEIIVMLLLMFISFSAFKQKVKWQAPKEADDLVNPLVNDAKATKKGMKIYRKLCWTCHGKLGKGDGPAGKSLNPKPANHTSKKVQSQTDGAIFWKITHGKGAMPTFGNMLSKTERWQLVNYIRELGKSD